MCVWVCPGRKEGRKDSRYSRANTYARGARAAIRHFYECAGRRWAYLAGTEANRGLISPRASCSFERHVAPRHVAPDRAALRRRPVRTGQLNRSGGFSIFCLIVSTMAAAAQKWLSARNTRHYTPPPLVPAHLFRFSHLIPAGPSFTFLPSLNSLYMRTTWHTFDQPNARDGNVSLWLWWTQRVSVVPEITALPRRVDRCTRADRVISRDTSRHRCYRTPLAGIINLRYRPLLIPHLACESLAISIDLETLEGAVVREPVRTYKSIYRPIAPTFLLGAGKLLDIIVEPLRTRCK